VRETKHAIHYVLFNQQKHEKGTYSVINDYSSVLYIKNGLDLIRKFAKEKALTLKIQKRSDWIPDAGSSYFARVALFS
jgi:hypothetical protein